MTRLLMPEEHFVDVKQMLGFGAYTCLNLHALLAQPSGFVVRQPPALTRVQCNAPLYSAAPILVTPLNAQKAGFTECYRHISVKQGMSLTAVGRIFDALVGQTNVMIVDYMQETEEFQVNWHIAMMPSKRRTSHA